jgi:hypothetical protein
MEPSSAMDLVMESAKGSAIDLVIETAKGPTIGIGDGTELVRDLAPELRAGL